MRTDAMRWRLEDVSWSTLDEARARASETLFLLACSASFIESGSDIYSRNLAGLFMQDAEVVAWLLDAWEPEELQHGRALRAYVERVWPEFDWEAAYAEFLSDYARLCVVERYESTCAQEMAARCIVEMGTTAYYHSLHALCDEPMLQSLAWRIRTDEVQHYKRFYRYFLRFRQRENTSRVRTLAALVRRMIDLQRSDATLGLRHAARWGQRCGIARDLAGGAARAANLILANVPLELGARMALKPLQLHAPLQRAVERPVALLARRFFLH